MVNLKTKEEILTIRKAGKILHEAMEMVQKKLRPGITTDELDSMVEEYIVSSGGTPSFKGFQGFPKSICSSIDSQVVHGIPGDRVLKEGEIVSIDIGVNVDGYNTDSAKTFAIGEVDARIIDLMNVTEKALQLGIEKATIGNKIGDISKAIQEYAESNGFSVVRQLVGHGIGKSLHEEPKVPNFVDNNDPGEKLEEGMVLAIEPMFTMESPDVITDPDGWTVLAKDGMPAAHFEHTIAVTKSGPKILTNGKTLELETN